MNASTPGRPVDSHTSPSYRVLVVTPAYNEEASVAETIRQVQAAVAHAEVVVVDDGSTDATAAVARRAGAHVLSLPFNLGVGGAMRVGYRFAYRKGFDVVVQIDADGQHNPYDVPALLAALDDADVVVGSRFLGETSYPVGKIRRFAMRVLAWRLSAIAGTPLTDVTSGFRAVGPRAIPVFARMYPVEYLGDTVEALVIASKSKLRISEISVTMHERAVGQASQTTLKGTVFAVRALGMIALARFQQWPVHQNEEIR
ncbi:MAG: glycosyltransferase family 2 protein [Nitriliruptoraceae bacterium]